MCVRTLSQIAVFTVMSVKTSAGTWTVYQQPHPWRKLTPWQPSVVSSSSVRSGASEASSPFLLEFRWLRFMQVIIANHSIIWLLRVPKPVFHIPLSYGSYNLSSFFFFFLQCPWALGVGGWYRYSMYSWVPNDHLFFDQLWLCINYSSEQL